MGVYVYALRSPKLIRRCVVEAKDWSFSVIDVASMSYAHKQTGFSFRDPRKRGFSDYDKYVAPAARLWENVPQSEMPKYVAITDNENKHKLEVGQPVFYFENGSHVSCADTPTYGNSVYCGRIVKIST